MQTNQSMRVGVPKTQRARVPVLLSQPNCCVTLGHRGASLGLTFPSSSSGEAPGKFI